MSSVLLSSFGSSSAGDTGSCTSCSFLPSLREETVEGSERWVLLLRLTLLDEPVTRALFVGVVVRRGLGSEMRRVLFAFVLEGKLRF